MFTREQIEKAKECKSVEELLAFAKENEVELTEEQANGLFADLSKISELSDEEAASAAGGWLEMKEEYYKKFV